MHDIVKLAAVSALVSGVIGIIPGWGLLVRRPWARMLTIVLGCFNLIDLPFGTTLGAYTLWVLQPAKSEMNITTTTSSRRHDLDALGCRAAMLLGVVYHVSLSFAVGPAWIGDASQSKVAYLFEECLHGFRMPLFMLLSGFFTAMLWRQKGVEALLWHRCRRVLFPCLLGLITVVPATLGAWYFAGRYTQKVVLATPASANILEAIRKGDAAALEAQLINPGADVSAASSSGKVPLESAEQPFSMVAGVAAIPNIPVDEQNMEQGRERVVTRLPSAGASELALALTLVYKVLTEVPLFAHLWFLWHLLWLVAAFAVCVLVAGKLRWRPAPQWLTLSPARLLWLAPLTMIPTWFSSFGHGEFGQDLSSGIIPVPRILLYHAVFFFFGALYYDCDDMNGLLGNSWRWSLPLTLLVVFPLALEFATGTFGLRDSLLPAKFHKPATVLLQVLFAWLMAFSCIGMFRSLLTRENPAIRYLSDSAYWLYLAHLPLCIVAQALISRWPLPVWVKLPLLASVLIGFLLLTYDQLVRYTWVGSMLNGPRKRPTIHQTRGRSWRRKTCPQSVLRGTSGEEIANQTMRP